MCGIFALLNYEDNNYSQEFINEQFMKGKGRGPESSILSKVGIQVMYGFHRLAINGLNDESNQPMKIDEIILICNGEIYNYKELYEMIDVTPRTQSDCEIIIHLYKKYGIEHTLELLDGVFSFVLLDQRTQNEDTKLYVARDPYGVRPLYILEQTAGGNVASEMMGFASELKCLTEFMAPYLNYSASHFEPGTYSIYNLPMKVSTSWELETKNTRYHTTGFSRFMYSSSENTNVVNWEYTTLINNLQMLLINSVEKRCVTTERKIACLLSGGLDSSLIAALVSEFHKMHNLPPIETYSIGLAGSEDLKYAAIVANHIGSVHTEIVLTEQDFTSAIPEVIRTIESYDTTSVRASIGNYYLGKYISETSDAKVIFNGDGSDELFGGYLYMACAPDALEFDRECKRLLRDIHAFDVLRSDKSISSHGLEPRTPFLDRSLVQYYLSIPAKIRYTKNSNKIEKCLLRLAFAKENFKNSEGNPLLPDEIIWRKKEAFSDGVSSQTRSLYQILQEYASEQMKDTQFDASFIKHNTPMTDEQKYYRKIFETHYLGLGNVVPYFWMPKYVDATDASARTLDMYKSDSTNTTVNVDEVV